jgi:hypothetical protein
MALYGGQIVNQQVNCYLVGGPMDGKTVVSEELRQDLRFTKPVLGNADRSRQSVADIFEMYYLAGVPDQYFDVKQAVYVHASCTHFDIALLKAATSRHAERDLLNECMTFLRASGINPSTGPYAEDRLALIRKIEEHLK